MDLSVNFKITGGFALGSLVIGAILYALDDMRITENTSFMGILLMGAGFGLILLALYLEYK